MKNKTEHPQVNVRKLMMALVSLLGALMLWIYVNSSIQDDYTETFNGVKVVFDGEATMREAKGLVLTERGVTTVKVSITGDRRTVSRLESADLAAVIDLSTISSTGRYTNSSYKLSYPPGIDTGTLELTSKIPESITFEVDQLNSKTVPVVGVFNGSVAEGYLAESLEFAPASVKIYGPQNSLDKVERAWIEVPRENVEKTLTYDSTYQLQDKEGNVIDDHALELERDTVSVTLPVNAVKEVSLGVKFINGGGATSDHVKLTIDPPKVGLTGDSAVLDGVNNIDLAVIDLADITGTSFTETYTIVIPNDTEITDGRKEATVNLELVGLSTKTVSVSNISCINTTDGYVPEIMSPNIEVTIRGSERVLRGISDVNVRAVADLTDYGDTTGFFSVPVRIYIDGTTEAGALGEYKVFISLSTATAEDITEE